MKLWSIYLAMLIIGFESYLYLSAGLGAGPRGNMMLYLLEKTNISLRFIRNSIELTDLIVGFLLGGPVGVGTIVLYFGLGFVIQLVFKTFRFDPNNLT